MRRALLMTFAAVWPAVATAQSPLLTMEDAVARALANHPRLRAVKAAEDEARAGADVAHATRLPRVDAVEAWQGGNQPVFVFGSLLAQQRFTAARFEIPVLNQPDAIDNHRAAIGVEQVVYDGAAVSSRAASAARGAEAAAFDSARAIDDIRAETITAFARAVAAVALRSAAAAVVTSGEEDLRRGRNRRDAGLETDANVLALQVRLAGARADLVRAEANASVARATLNSLMGAPLDEATPLAPIALDPVAPADVKTLEAKAISERSDLRAAGARQMQAEALHDSTRGQRLPQIVARAGVESNGATFFDRATSWTADVQVRLNVFSGGADAARRRETAAAVVRAAAERDVLRMSIELEVRAGAAAYDSAVAREAISRDMAAQARESQRVIRDRYDAGLAPVTDLVRASELVASADATRISAAADVAIARAALDRAAGKTGDGR